jgi:hypothetical protein
MMTEPSVSYKGGVTWNFGGDAHVDAFKNDPVPSVGNVTRGLQKVTLDFQMLST